MSLPNESLIDIFKFIPVDILQTRLRRVSRLWKDLVDYTICQKLKTDLRVRIHRPGHHFYFRNNLEFKVHTIKDGRVLLVPVEGNLTQDMRADLICDRSNLDGFTNIAFNIWETWQPLYRDLNWSIQSIPIDATEVKSENITLCYAFENWEFDHGIYKIRIFSLEIDLSRVLTWEGVRSIKADYCHCGNKATQTCWFNRCHTCCINDIRSKTGEACAVHPLNRRVRRRYHVYKELSGDNGVAM